ncbi:Pectate lyase, partial [Phytophthora infestans]
DRQNTTASVPDGVAGQHGHRRYKKPYTIKFGEVQMQTFRALGRINWDQDTAEIFLVGGGGTLKNAIIGRTRKEGVHCEATIESRDDRDQLRLATPGTRWCSTTATAPSRSRGFFAQEFGKLYRSCGTCGNIPRKVTVENVFAIDPLVRRRHCQRNNNDQATLKNIFVKTTDGRRTSKVCQWSQASKTLLEAATVRRASTPSVLDEDVHINED